LTAEPLIQTAGTEGEQNAPFGRHHQHALRLTLFLDDFSTYTGLPDDLLWSNGVLINNRFALNPPTGGVATFDGLRQTEGPLD
jgi:hypothetical protein